VLTCKWILRSRFPVRPTPYPSLPPRRQARDKQGFGYTSAANPVHGPGRRRWTEK
jgi:hypothetical protein